VGGGRGGGGALGGGLGSRGLGGDEGGGGENGCATTYEQALHGGFLLGDVHD
jgi:hypothetical protein